MTSYEDLESLLLQRSSSPTLFNLGHTGILLFENRNTFSKIILKIWKHPNQRKGAEETNKKSYIFEKVFLSR